MYAEPMELYLVKLSGVKCGITPLDATPVKFGVCIGFLPGSASSPNLAVSASPTTEEPAALLNILRAAISEDWVWPESVIVNE